MKMAKCNFCSRSLPAVNYGFCPSCGSNLPSSGSFNPSDSSQPSNEQMNAPWELAQNFQQPTISKRKLRTVLIAGLLFFVGVISFFLFGNSTNGINKCSNGPECFIPFSRITFPEYGNVFPSNLGDCTFAAAADYVALREGVTPDPAVIGYAYAITDPTGNNGVTAQQLGIYWQRHSLGGYKLASVVNIDTSEIAVKKALRKYKALYVSFEFHTDSSIGAYQTGSGGHAAIIDGFTPTGPLIVTWGMTIQMTWQQWNYNINSVYYFGLSH